MNKEFKVIKVFSRTILLKSYIVQNRGNLVMDANSKNFEVEIMAREQTKKEILTLAKIEPAKTI